MEKRQPAIVTAGWSLLWQTQRILWWVYAVNLVLGFFSAGGLALRNGTVLNQSLAAARLYHGFDLSTVIELITQPEVQLGARATSSLSFAAIFFVFMLFATGGILESYARNRMLVPGEFFQGCGAFFWRFVRLLLWLLVVLVPVAMPASGVNGLSDRLSDTVSGKLGFEVLAAGAAILVLLLMAVRLWFDIAQARLVVEDERGVTRALGQAFRLTRDNFVALFWMYFRLSALGWMGTIAALAIWIKLVPAERIGITFLLMQFVALLWIAIRLWQRASEVIWYQRQRPEPAAVPVPESAAAEDAEQAPAPEQLI